MVCGSLELFWVPVETVIVVESQWMWETYVAVVKLVVCVSVWEKHSAVVSLVG